jgi:uncharacterized protein (AIM24 family)
MLSLGLAFAATTLGCGSSTTTEEITEPDVAPWSLAFASEDGSSKVSAITVSASGNIALTGEFSSDIDFGGGTLEATAQPSFYVAKLSAAGAHVWSGRTGGGDDFATSIALDRGGSALVAGNFNGELDLGSGELSGSIDGFLARFGASGIPIWSKKFGVESGGGDTVNDIAVSDTDGSIHLTGIASGDADFGAGPIAPAQWSTLYVTKLAADGEAVFSRAFLTDVYANGRKIAVDNDGNTILAGEFSGNLDLGGGSLGSFNEYGFFVAKLDANGNHVWSKGFTTNQGLQLADIAVAPDGSVLLAGSFNGSLDFGGGELTGQSFYDIFLAKLGPDGSHRFSKRFGDPNTYPYCAGVAVDGEGNVYLSGSFEASINIDGEALTSVGNLDVFLAKFDPNGGLIQTGSFGGSDSQQVSAMAVDRWGNVVLAGSFSGSLDFGPGLLDAGTDRSLFVARLP